MKTKLVAFVILASFVFFNVNSASAGCVYGCPDPSGSFSPPSPTLPVHGVTIMPPVHQQPATFSVKGGGNHQGFGTGFSHGDQGFSKVVTDGGTNVNTTLNASGNLCPGTSCTSGNFTFQGKSWQSTETSAGALSNGGHSYATAGNSGSANTGLNFTKQ